MSERSYRATVRGRFGPLPAEQHQSLLAQQEDHTMFASRFIPEGVFLYERELVGFQFKYLLTSLEQSRSDADVEASLVAEHRAETDLRARGLAGKNLEVSIVCLEDTKQRKRKTL